MSATIGGFNIRAIGVPDPASRPPLDPRLYSVLTSSIGWPQGERRSTERRDFTQPKRISHVYAYPRLVAQDILPRYSDEDTIPWPDANWTVAQRQRALCERFGLSVPKRFGLPRTEADDPSISAPRVIHTSDHSETENRRSERPRKAIPESFGQAQTWDERFSAYRRSGFCGRCASIAAWSHQNGFSGAIAIGRCCVGRIPPVRAGKRAIGWINGDAR